MIFFYLNCISRIEFQSKPWDTGQAKNHFRMYYFSLFETLCADLNKKKVRSIFFELLDQLFDDHWTECRSIFILFIKLHLEYWKTFSSSYQVAHSVFIQFIYKKINILIMKNSIMSWFHFFSTFICIMHKEKYILNLLKLIQIQICNHNFPIDFAPTEICLILN